MQYSPKFTIMLTDTIIDSNEYILRLKFYAKINEDYVFFNKHMIDGFLGDFKIKKFLKSTVVNTINENTEAMDYQIRRTANNATTSVDFSFVGRVFMITVKAGNNIKDIKGLLSMISARFAKNKGVINILKGE